MKNISITVALSTIFLFSCGGSDSNTADGASKSGVVTTLSNTSWEKACSSYNKVSGDQLKDLWNVKIKLSIDSSLKATYRAQYFSPTDTTCDSMMFDSIDISTFEVTNKVISEESIQANALNEMFTYSSDNRDLSPNYSLIYIANEKLYFGQKSGSNIGDTPETRHSSISLDDYFSQIIN